MKILKISSLFFALSLMIAFNSYSDTLPGTVEEKVSVFFQQMQKGEAQPAIDKIIEGSKIGQNPAQIQNLISQVNNSITIYGPVVGSAYVNSFMIGDTLCKAVFLSKHANYPLRWTFLFYKGATDWILINIEFDDNVEVLF